MIFNSLDFALFLPVVFILYWFVTHNSLRAQNFLIVVASYLFYGWWDWRFLSLIFFSTLVDYLVGLGLANQQTQLKRKLLLWISILINLGLLCYFKYFNFFIDNFKTAFTFFGAEINSNSLHIILPLGISFYTFQTMSYSIDVYRKKLEPTTDFIAFSAFVTFFPQLVAGPIERATNLLPQFYTKRKFNYENAVNGMRQILWGLFKKMVIADNIAVIANTIFSNSDDYSGSTLFLGAVFFAFQIYGDFSGYSDIAIGTSRLFGFNLMQNFNFPYFSRDIAEFWRKWHISLSTWFRDYLYLPLGGSRGGQWKSIRNVFIVFAVSGFWHGANWTFIVWGLLNAIYFLPLLLKNKNRSHLDTVARGQKLPSVKELGLMLLTFTLTVFGWIFFRAENMTHAISYISEIFSASLFTLPEVRPYPLIILLCAFTGIEWMGRENQYALEKIGATWKPWLRYAMYYGIVLTLIWFSGQKQVFIYFQF